MNSCAFLLLTLVLGAYSKRDAISAEVGGRNSVRSRLPETDSSGSNQNPGDYVRITVEILQLTNNQGLAYSGSSCDFAGTCDTTLSANLDTQRPNAEWPGAKADSTWPTIYGVDDVNSPKIEVTIHKDICGTKYTEANLRIAGWDRDPASKDDLINQWNCPINRQPSRNEAVAEWSPVFECLPKYIPDKMKLTYKYKVYYIAQSQCKTTA